MKLAHKVVARYKLAVFLSDSFWRERKRVFKSILDSPLSEKRPNGLAYDIEDKLVPFFTKTVQSLKDLGLPSELEHSLDFRLDNIVSIVRKMEDQAKNFQKAYGAAMHYDRPSTSAKDLIEWEIANEIENLYEGSVKTIGAGLKATWSTDTRLIEGLATRLVKKATPEELDAIFKTVDDWSSRLLEIKYGFYNRVNLKGLAKKLIQKDKFTYDISTWVDRIREMIIANYTNLETLAPKQFDLYGMKVIVDDSNLDDNQIRAYVKFLDEAYHRLKNKRMTQVWYGTVFIKCESCGGVNPNTSGGVGGDYPIGPDVVNVYSRPSPFIVELMAHELGHRYWFKQMTESQRARFKALVKVNTIKPATQQSITKTENVIKDTTKSLKDLVSDFVRERDIAKFAPLFDRAVLDENHVWKELNKLSYSKANPKLEALMESYTGTQKSAEVELRVHFVSLKKEYAEWMKEGGDKSDFIREWANDAYIYIQRHHQVALQYTSLVGTLNSDPEDTREVPAVSDYGASNIDEAFAEAFMHYIVEADMTRDQLESFRSVLTKTASEGSQTQAFTTGFFAKYSKLRKYAPKRVLDKPSGSGSHPEARQSGDDIWLFPKFWNLDSGTKDFVFAHELGHLFLSNFGLSKFITLLQKEGIDPWDSSNLPFGQHNMDEAFADCFASYFMDNDVSKRYPKWADLLKSLL